MTYPQLTFRIGNNGKPEGVDWDALRAAYRAQLDLQVAAGVDDHETRSWAAEKAGLPAPAPTFKPKRTGNAGGGSSPRYDRSSIANMYVQDRLTVDDIALKIGAHRQTIRNNLKAAGVTLRDDRVGNPRGRMGRTKA